MNDRIKELAIEAGMILGVGSEFDMAKFMPKEVKFAELIVRECCRVMESLPPSTYHVGRTRMSEEIKQHFGVEL
jgi:hypothetical protein